LKSNAPILTAKALADIALFEKTALVVNPPSPLNFPLAMWRKWISAHSHSSRTGRTPNTPHPGPVHLRGRMPHGGAYLFALRATEVLDF
jgi:hypothetical protein